MGALKGLACPPSTAGVSTSTWRWEPPGLGCTGLEVWALLLAVKKGRTPVPFAEKLLTELGHQKPPRKAASPSTTAQGRGESLSLREF